MSNLVEIHSQLKKNKIKCDKWENYLHIYDQYLSVWKNKNPVIVEIGIYQGGSVELWKRYFNNNFTYFGIDITPMRI